jgi:hypothetical protein
MREAMWVRDSLDWSWLIGSVLPLLAILAILVLMLRAGRRPFKKKLQVRRAKEKEARRRRSLLVESVQAHLLPAFIKLGFQQAPPRSQNDSDDRKYSGCFPSWGQLTRARDTTVDKVEIQFSSYGRAAFRINATAVPKDGIITAFGHRIASEIQASGLHDHFETHARPWLRSTLRALRVEPLGEWFSLWRLPLRSPTQADYDRLSLQAVAILPELELALREGKTGPHIRRLEFEPFADEVLERIAKLKADGAMDKSQLSRDNRRT